MWNWWMENATFEFAFSLHPHTHTPTQCSFSSHTRWRDNVEIFNECQQKTSFVPSSFAVWEREREKRHVLLCLSCYRCDDAKELSDDKRIFSFSNNSLASLDCMLRKKSYIVVKNSFHFFILFRLCVWLTKKQHSRAK